LEDGIWYNGKPTQYSCIISTLYEDSLPVRVVKIGGYTRYDPGYWIKRLWYNAFKKRAKLLYGKSVCPEVEKLEKEPRGMAQAP